jgi:adenylosuccinate synthase
MDHGLPADFDHQRLVARRALRVLDLFYPERFAERLRELLDYHNFVLTQYLKAEAVDYNKSLSNLARNKATTLERYRLQLE